jgi:hypothetical protein
MYTPDLIKKMIGFRKVTEISEVSGIPINSIHNWKHGKSEPSFFNLLCLANACGYRLHFEKVTDESMWAQTSLQKGKEND